MTKQTMTTMGIPRRTAILGFGLVVTASAAAAVSPRVGDAEAFAAFKTLTGVWRGGGETEGGRYRDYYRFEEAALGRYLRAEYSMQSEDGSPLWHDFGAYGIHPNSGRFFTQGFGSDGATAESTLHSFEPGQWQFYGHTDGSTVFRDYRFMLRLAANGALTALTEIPERSGWRVLFKGVYTKDT